MTIQPTRGKEFETATVASPAGWRPVEVRIARPFAPTQRAVTVILPVYNEAPNAAHIAGQVIRFARGHESYRFIFVDDGSSDATPDLLRASIAAASGANMDPASRVQVMGYRTNAGKGYAVARAVLSVEGDDDDAVIFTDGDLAYSLDHLLAVERALAGADVVIGSRRVADGDYRAAPVRNVMGWTYNRLARVCLGCAFRDTQAGLKGFRLGAARRIFTATRILGFAFDVEVLYLARRFGFRIAEVPATVQDSHRAQGSRVNLWREPRRMFVGLAGIRVDGRLGAYERHAAGRVPLALMSFDAEEFDLPNEYGHDLRPDAQMAVAAEGMRHALDLLEDVPARATFFITAAFALAHPAFVKEAAARGHEIASHGARHSSFQRADLARSRRTLESIAGVPVTGFRRARFAPTHAADIADAGYTYDSSIHPIWLPGRYNGLRYPRRAFQQEGVVRIPVSVTPLVRFPLAWFSFKNIPQWAVRDGTRWVLAADKYMAMCFHPWELCDLARYGVPRYVRRIDGRSMRARLTRYLRWVSRRASFATYSELDTRFRTASWPFGPGQPAD